MSHFCQISHPNIKHIPICNKHLRLLSRLGTPLAYKIANSPDSYIQKSKRRIIVRLEIYGILVLGLMVFALALETARAEEQAKEQVVKFGISADYYTKYIWRGQNVDDKSVFQPAVSVSAHGFTGSIWGNMDMTNKSLTAPDNAGEFSEFDYTLDYSGTMPGIDWLGFSVGTIYYRFPNTVFEPTTEIYGGLSLPKVPLSPYFKWYRDVDEIDGSYFQFGIGHTIEKIYTFNEKCYCGLQLGASYGCGNAAYNKGYFGVDSGQLNDFTLTAGLPFCMDTWMIRPSINYSTMLSNSIRDATERSDNIWTGVGISTSF